MSRRSHTHTLIFAFFIAISASTTLAQLGRVTPTSRSGKESQTNTATASSASIEVSKTAFVDGENVCGAIHITNVGSQPAMISKIADSLEVHFPHDGASSLPAGSTKTWYKVADVPITLPGTITPGKTNTIDYCFSLCQATVSPGANSMRNVVAVSVTTPGGVRTFATRSVSFPPPALDCQACCVPDGSCINTVSNHCTATGGVPRGTGSDCATTECPQACCHIDGTCTDEGPSACHAAAGEPSGPGTNCASTTCCAPLGTGACADPAECCGVNASCKNDACCIDLGITGCAADSECCGFSAFDHNTICEAGKCCAPIGRDFACRDASDCCNPNAICPSGYDGTCCLPNGTTGCAADAECCGLSVFDQSHVVCEAGRCCAPTGRDFACRDASDCCNPNAICPPLYDGTCCLPNGTTGCTADSECCGISVFDQSHVVCEAGKCCAPTGRDFACSQASDCCNPNAICAGSDSTCCIPIGTSGCTNSFDCCPGLTIFDDGAICESGRCCAPIGVAFLCDSDSDCCGNGICAGSDHSCCIPMFHTGCNTDFDCCPGTFCTGGICEGANEP